MHDFTERMRQGMRELRAAREAATGRNSLQVRFALSKLETLCEPEADPVDLRSGARPGGEGHPVSLG
ncbi:MAG: hypothetical protein JWL84_3344 [Rhodospirillales bacterium]|jgi:hypothetical protein|nr:hypothetical protein [Rhodospirillales bacterium]